MTSSSIRTTRFLIAIAFLAASSTTLLTIKELRSARFDLWCLTRHVHRAKVSPLIAPALPSILLIIFLVLALITLLVLFSSLGPNLTHPLAEQSLLFFEPIARDADAEWHAHWPPEADSGFEERLAREYVTHTRQLALNAEFKVHRNNDARFFLVLATIAFASGALLGGFALMRSPERSVLCASAKAMTAPISMEAAATTSTRKASAVGGDLFRWQGAPQFSVMALLALVTALAAYEVHRLALVDSWTSWAVPDSASGAENKSRRIPHWGFWALTVAGVAWSGAVIGLAYGSLRCAGEAVIVAAMVLALLALAKGLPPTTRSGRVGHFLGGVLVVALGVAALIFLARRRPDLLLALSPGPLVLFASPRLASTLTAWTKRVDRMRCRTDAAAAERF